MDSSQSKPAQTLAGAPIIVGICGSLSADSTTRRALKLALQAAENAGGQTSLIDLRDLKLPFASSDWDAADYPDAEKLLAAVRGADGLLWATPEYHGSYSGALKNALDLGDIPDYDGKVVALLGVAAGSIGAIQSLSHLRGIARQLHMWAVPSQLSIAQSYAAFDENGALKDAKLAASLEKMSAELVRWSAVHRSVNSSVG